MNIEAITKFDLEAAFKALDDIAVPAANGGIKSNRAPLNEIFSKKTKFDALIEEYSESNLVESQNDYTWHRKRSDGNLISIRQYNSAAKEAGLALEDPRVCAALVSSLIRDFCEIEWQPEDNNLSIQVANEILKFSDDAEKEQLTLSQIEHVFELLTAWFEANSDNNTYLAQQQRDENKRFIARVRQDLQQVKNLDEDNIDIFVHAFETNCTFIDAHDWSYMNDLRVKVAKLNNNHANTNSAKLTEEYYDIGDQTELSAAKETREAEVAMAKLARIEKIVDLDAESPDDLLASYVGKFIIQCPQCMTLFYKNPEDIEKSEDDPETCNVNEVCQHCGNESGYTLIGKVGEATEEEVAEVATYSAEEESEEPADDTVELEQQNDDAQDDADLALDDIDLDEIDFEIEDDESEAKESFNVNKLNSALVEQLSENATLTEDDLDISDAEFSALISSPEFKKPITTAEVRTIIDSDTDNSDLKKKDQISTQDAELAEGVFDKLKNSIKDKAEKVVDKLAAAVKTREEKANFVLANAIKDGGTAEIGSDDKLIITDENKRFTSFIVLCFKEHYTTGRLITIAPKYNSTELVIATNPVEKDNYKQADQIAKGWSMKQGNGPAMIFLAAEPEDPEAVFLCEYFKGELVNNDQLETCFKAVRDDLKAGKLMAKGGMDQSGETTAESFNTIMSGIDNLNEELLESFIADSLIENYKHIAGFRITNCEYLNEQLLVLGQVYLTSGANRPTSYIFNAATLNNGKCVLSGLNESLKSHKNITVTGNIDESRTFITETFTINT